MKIDTKHAVIYLGISVVWHGGRSRIRTYGPLIKSQLLYQLSYAPTPYPPPFRAAEPRL